MNRRLRTALVVSAALSAGLLMTACEGGSTGAAEKTGTASSGSPTAEATTATATPGAARDGGTGGTGDKAEGTSSSGTSGTSGTSSSSSQSSSGDSDAADKSGYDQGCGTNDLQWSARPMTQAGGYYLVSVKARSGITCVLPAGLPVFAFGSGGTQADPAEQVAGEEITLSGGRTAYAGVTPKSTNGDTGTEYSTVIVSVSEDDPHPLSLNVGSVVVDKPLTTNWHTNPADAVPFTS
ncbi:DUF4232 domain-containing protein [Streptomyces sp. ALI-76-A]|uniref:DUF4232 domain-containing protein n=1 Tax=Streptomyces sp. ALI-76-A TaxID=3025736 RepID=UPI00256EC77A|nr:DUF4232 domain-containing protein [Streptomyces sp. ALI-76-A]MDL5201746.1 DUF4232 domain-containing protein [Streptomyces sp. ALI-76-A]